MKNIIRLFVFFPAVFSFTLMNLKDSAASIYSVNLTMNGSKVVPPVTTNGLGTITGTYNDVTNELIFNLSFSGLSGVTTGGHFHGPASVTENAGTLISWSGFPLGVTSGTYSNTFILPDFMETVLLQGRMYADIHTAFAFNGEIRSQMGGAIRSILLDYLIEGMYDPVTNTLVRDTVTLNLRSSTFPYSIVEGRRAKLDSTGRATFLPWDVAPSFVPFYIQIRHRNALETWSSTTITWNSSLISYVFKNAITKAYGSNMVMVNTSPLSFAAYSGDVNQDGIIDGADGILIDNDAAAFNTGYLPTDVNGDNIIDGSDAVITDNNAANFVTAVSP